MLAVIGFLTTDMPSANAVEIPEFYTSVRAIGMGGAHTAVAMDESSLWTNPAGIARIRKARGRRTFNLISFPNAVLGANTTGQNFFSGVSGANEEEIAELVAKYSADADKPHYIRAGAAPTIFFDSSRETAMAFAAFSNTTGNVVVSKEDPTVARTSFISDIGGVIGYSYQNNANRFNIGVQLRPVIRYGYEDIMATTDLTETDKLKARLTSDANRTSAVAADAGLLWTVADFWFPTVGVSALNLPTGCRNDYLNPFSKVRQKVCGTKYSGTIPNPEALSLLDPTDIRIGVAITPRFHRKFAARFALDAHHLPVTSGTSNYTLPGIEASKLLHGGVEIFFGNPLLQSPFSLRVGANQGFATFGVGIRASWLALDVASYGVDVSDTATPVEDRRYLGSMSIEF